MFNVQPAGTAISRRYEWQTKEYYSGTKWSRYSSGCLCCWMNLCILSCCCLKKVWISRHCHHFQFHQTFVFSFAPRYLNRMVGRITTIIMVVLRVRRRLSCFRKSSQRWPCHPNLESHSWEQWEHWKFVVSAGLAQCRRFLAAIGLWYRQRPAWPWLASVVCLWHVSQVSLAGYCTSADWIWWCPCTAF